MPVASGFGGVLHVVLFVIIQVAALAPCTKVFRVVIFWSMVKVCNGQHYFATSIWMGLIVRRSTIWKVWRTFTAVAGTLKNGSSNFLPV